MDMDMQGLFNKAVGGLRAQDYKLSFAKGKCKYRSGDGCKCAMGHCIPDDLYELGYEGFSAAAVMETIPGLAELYGVSLVSVNLGRRHVTTPEQKFLNEMQYHLHDAFMQRELERCLYKNNPEETMEEAFREFASTYSMVMPAKEG